MNSQTLLLSFATFLVGAGIPLQAILNARLSQALGHVTWVGAFSAGLASLLALLAGFVMKAKAQNLEAVAATPIWSWFGGALALAYLITVTLVSPKLGSSRMVTLLIAGQVAAALLLDLSPGIYGSIQDVSLLRWAGTALIIGGVILVQK